MQRSSSELPGAASNPPPTGRFDVLDISGGKRGGRFCPGTRSTNQRQGGSRKPRRVCTVSSTKRGTGHDSRTPSRPRCTSNMGHWRQLWLEAQPFRIFLCRRLRLPLPLSSRTCRCGLQLDSFGLRRAACSEAGVFCRRVFPLDCGAAPVCKEAGARVSTNAFYRDLDLTSTMGSTDGGSR